MKSLFKRLDQVIDNLEKNKLTTSSIYFKYNKLNRRRLSKHLWDNMGYISEFTIGSQVSFVYRGVAFYIEDYPPPNQNPLLSMRKIRLSQAQANVINYLMENDGSYVIKSNYFNHNRVVAKERFKNSDGYETFELMQFNRATLNCLIKFGCLKSDNGTKYTL